MIAIIVILLVAGFVFHALSLVRLGKNIKAYSKGFFYYLFNWYDLEFLPTSELDEAYRLIAKSFVLMVVGAALGICSYVIRNLTNGEWSSGELVASPAELAFYYFTGEVVFLFFFPMVRLFLHRLLATFWHKCMD